MNKVQTVILNVLALYMHLKRVGCWYLVQITLMKLIGLQEKNSNEVHWGNSKERKKYMGKEI